MYSVCRARPADRVRLPYKHVRLISYLAGINARCLTGITVQCAHVGSYRRRSLPRPALSISKLRPITDLSPTSERFYSLRFCSELVIVCLDFLCW